MSRTLGLRIVTLLFTCMVISAAFALFRTARPPTPARTTLDRLESRSEPAGPSPANHQPPRAGVGETRSRTYPYNRVVVISIGIDKYPHLTSVGPVDLRVAERDAASFAELTSSQYGYEVVLITGSQATKERITATLERYGRELGERDAVIVFFAGHGKVIELSGKHEAGFLIPVDADLDMDDISDPGRWADEALDMTWLTQLIDGMSAQHVLLIADACNSGFMTGRGSMERWDLKNFLSDRSRVVFTATDRRQDAREDVVAGSGYFTSAVVEALRDRRDAASVLDIFAPVLRSVSARSSGQMMPQLAHVGEGYGMFVFVPLTLSKEEIEADLEALRGGTIGTARGFGGAVGRLASQSKQLTTKEQFFALLEAPDPRLAERSEDVQADWEERRARFERNAQLNDVWAIASLCLCYEKGLGVERDGTRAYELARQADRFSTPAGVGRFLLGRCYQYGLGVSLSGDAAWEEALELYADSGELGFGPGLWACAIAILNGQPKDEEVEFAGGLLRRAVELGVPGAKVDLARMLRTGVAGGPPDVDEMMRLMEEAAEAGVPRAHHDLYGILTDGGEGHPPVDRARAERHLRSAARLGSIAGVLDLAAEHLGNLERLGLPRDDPEAFALYDRAAQVGNAGALTMSALMLSQGRGVSFDHGLARERIERAAAAGLTEAVQQQGEWYAAGTVYPRDEAKALRCFIEAADRGLPTSCLRAGQMFTSGVVFAPRNGLDDGELHDDWHRGLHYLMKAHELGGADERSAAKAAGDRFLRALRGDTSARRARSVAVAWSRDYPSTFRYFYEQWSFDPRSFGLVPKAELPAQPE